MISAHKNSPARRRSLSTALLAAMIAALGSTFITPSAHAATITKADNTTTLHSTGAWVGAVVPTSVDVALFDSTITSGNLTVGTNTVSIGSIQVLNPAGNYTVNLATNNTLTLNISGSGIDMSAATADLTINGGFLRIASGNYNTAFNVATGRTLTIGSQLTNQGNTKTFIFSGGGNVILNGNSGAGGATSFSITGANVTMNSGTNAWAGGTITSGSLTAGNTTALSTFTTTVNAANGLKFGTGIFAATLGNLAGSGSFSLVNAESNGVALTVGNANSTTYSGVLSGTGSVTKVGAGTLTLGVSGQSYSGATNVSGGVLAFSSSGALTSNLIGAGGLNLSNGGKARFLSTSSTTIDSALDVGTGGGILSFHGNTTFSPTAITGSGALTIDIDSGVTATPTTFQNWNGTVNVSTTGSAATFRQSGTADIGLGNAALNLGTGIAMTRNAGTNGAFTTNIGTLSGATGSSIGGSSAGSGVFTYSVGSRNESSTFAGVVLDGGTKTAFTKVGTGTQTFSGANTFTGALNVTAGTVATDGTGIFSAGDVTVAAGAGLTFGNSASIGDLSALVFASTSSITLGFSGSETIGSVVNSVTSTSLAAGTYDAAALNAYFGGISAFSGIGTITVGSAIPEPTTYAAMAGLAGLAFAAYRRRKAA